MIETRIDELLDKTNSKFALVIAAAKRTRQITDFLNVKNPGETLDPGSIPPPVNDLMTKKPLMIALDEIANGAIDIIYVEPAAEETVTTVDEPTTIDEAPTKIDILPENSILAVKAPEETMEEGEPQDPIETALDDKIAEETPDQK